MRNRYRKPKLWRASGVFAVVIGDASVVPDKIVRRKNTAWKNAKKLRKRPTQAEQKLERILNSLQRRASGSVFHAVGICRQMDPRLLFP
jgi:hypothetical protein